MKILTGKSLKFLCYVIPALLTLILIACSGSDLKGTITEDGSTTVYPLAKKLADTFTGQHPNVIINTGQGGSGVGIQDVDGGKVDIGASSRSLTAADPKLESFLIGHDGLVIVTHPSNSLHTSQKENIVKLFSGEINNWKEIGGQDLAISVVTREAGSGTLSSFQDLVMGKTQIKSTAVVEQSNGEMRTYVSTNPGAVGFLSLGYIDASINPIDIDGIVPSIDNCKSSKYPFVRPLYFLTRAEPTGVVKAFIDYSLSKEGQNIVSNEGFITAN